MSRRLWITCDAGTPDSLHPFAQGILRFRTTGRTKFPRANGNKTCSSETESRRQAIAREHCRILEQMLSNGAPTLLCRAPQSIPPQVPSPSHSPVPAPHHWFHPSSRRINNPRSNVTYARPTVSPVAFRGRARAEGVFAKHAAVFDTGIPREVFIHQALVRRTGGTGIS